MSEAIFRNPVDEARWLESSVLKSRLLTIGVAALLFAALPWPYSRWLQAGIIFVWLAQGIIAANFVRRATSVVQINWSGRILLALDTLVLTVPIFLYLPILPEVWIAVLIPIMWGGVRERLAGAASVAALATLLLVVAFAFHRVAPSAESQVGRLLFDVGIIWLSVLAVRQLVRAVALRNEALAAQREKLEKSVSSQADMRARADMQAATLKKVTELAVSLLREQIGRAHV
jgi:hypothetical protein